MKSLSHMKSLSQYYSQKAATWEKRENSSLSRFKFLKAIAATRRMHFSKLHSNAMYSENAVIELKKKDEIYSKVQALPSLLGDLDNLTAFLQMNGLGTEHGYSCISEQKDKVLVELDKIANSILSRSNGYDKVTREYLKEHEPMIKYWITCYLTLSDTFKSVESPEDRYQLVKSALTAFNQSVHATGDYIHERYSHDRCTSLKERDPIQNKYVHTLQQLGNVTALPAGVSLLLPEANNDNGETKRKDKKNKN